MTTMLIRDCITGKTVTINVYPLVYSAFPLPPLEEKILTPDFMAAQTHGPLFKMAN